MSNQELEPKKKKVLTIQPITYLFSMLAVIVLSVGITYAVTANPSPLANNTSKEEAKKVDEEFKKFSQVYHDITEKYYDDVDSEKLIEGALAGMTASLEDPYSQYLNVEEASALNSSISASFEGIGAEVSIQNGDVTIVSPIAGSPAEKAGILPNDIVTKVGDTEVKGMDLGQAVNLIRGEKGTDVSLTIQRGTQTFNLTITRDTIPVETVISKMDENNPTVGYIKITSFSEPTYNELKQAVIDLREKGATSFILDVKQNPGGLLDQAIDISSMFMEDGQTILQVQGKTGDPKIYQASSSKNRDFKVTEPVVVLIDEGSASASEIFAAALQESANVTLVGVTSFGKGTVQTMLPYQDNSELKITIAKWLTPSGNWIHEKGIEPDVEVALPDYAKLTLIDSKEKYQESDLSDGVKNIEAMLAALSYDSGKVDGFFDATTKAAVEKFQKDQNLPVDGIVTGDTSYKMIEKLRELLLKNDTQYQKALEILEK
ncbi:S41 family peptidase [Isobaculum melis]|uniref:Carboxyl-terminal processing protease n=1 Tax=Isobaculum melis TaxID=142588 RepID=A0A1H9RZG2_9LACT|nr:S41 family peptidase [Isobaculum melis]SER77259.1 carboxyl-terminal processing protease [Isobaculum melis]